MTSVRQLSPKKRDRSYRVEISKSVKLEVFRRAGGPECVTCEGCGLVLGGKRFDYDHTVAEVFRTASKNQRPPITADDVKLLGYACCHSEKSAREVKANSHGKRIVEKAARVKKKSAFKGWRKFNGDVVWND
jgi:hypothetical protein